MVWLFNHLRDTREHLARSLTESLPKIRCDISVGNAFRGSVATRVAPGVDIRSKLRAARLLGEDARDPGRDDGREPALERAGVPGIDTYSHRCEAISSNFKWHRKSLTTSTSSSSLPSSVWWCARVLSRESRVCVRRTSCKRLISVCKIGNKENAGWV
jgi:hypothetical protein